MASAGRPAWGTKARGRVATQLPGMLLVAILPCAGVATAAPTDSAARRGAGSTPPVVDASPGRVVTLAFPLENAGRDTVAWTLHVALPDGWRLLSGAVPLRLVPRERRPHFIQVALPAAAPAGPRLVILTRRVAGGRTAGTDTAQVLVRAVRALDVEVTKVPPAARAGEPYAATFVVRNRGNRAEDVRVAVTERQRFATQASWSAARLAPGEARSLQVDVVTDGGLRAQQRHFVAVRAVAVDTSLPGTVAARATSAVLVVPGRAGADAPLHRLRARARLITGHTPGSAVRRGATTIELAGGGTLRAGSATRVDFLARGPQATTGAFHERDEYRVSLASSRLDVTVGDQAFALPPLVGQAREGTGVHAFARAAGFGIGALAWRNRRGAGAGARAASLRYERPRLAMVGAHVIERGGSDSGRVASVTTRLDALPLATLEVEVARRMESAGEGAHLVQLGGARPRFSYALRDRRVVAGFPGPGAGVRERRAQLDARVAGRAGVRVQGADQRVARGGEGGQWGRAQDDRHVQASAYFGRALSAGWHVAERRAVVMGDTVDARRTMMRLQGVARVGPVTLRADVDAGTVTRRGDSAAHPALATRLQATVAGRAGSVSLFAGRLPQAQWHLPTRPGQHVGGVSAMLRPAHWLALRGGATASRVAVAGAPTAMHADAALTLVPQPGHEMSLQLRSAAVGGLAGGEPAVRLAYSVPFGVPVGRTRTGGRLIGRVYDAESGRGVPDALVLVGDRMAMTDSDGRVEIGGLREGTEYLQLDLGADSDRIATRPSPLTVVSRNRGTTRVDVAVVRRARVDVRVERLAPASAGTWDGARASLTDTLPLAGVAVTLARDGETIRRSTGATGAFRVDDLRPGRWIARVAAAELPPHHYPDIAEVVLDIAPGGTGEVRFVALPRRRTVVMVDRAEVIADTPAATRAGAAARPAGDAPRQGATPMPAMSPRVDGPAAGRVLILAPRSWYVVGRTDRTLANVALHLYGDASLWPRLWLANQGVVTDPERLRAGSFLLLPPSGPLTAAERRARDEWLRKR